MIDKVMTPIMGCSMALLAMALFGQALWTRLPGNSVSPLQMRSVMPTVTQLERIGELASTRVHVTDILSADGDGYRGSWLINGDALLSCDLSKAFLTDINPGSRTARIRLPLPRVTSSRVNHDRTTTWCVERTTWIPWKLGNQNVMRDAAMLHAQQLVEETASSESNIHFACEHTELIIQRMYQLIYWDIVIEWDHSPETTATDLRD